MQRVTGRDLHRCPVCGTGLLHLVATVPRATHPFRQALAPLATGPPSIAITS